jgi:hypothetical protein
MIKMGSHVVFGAFHECSCPVKRNTVLPLLKKEWKVELTEDYTHKIFSTVNITLNMNKIIVIFYFLVENAIELLWT